MQNSQQRIGALLLKEGFVDEVHLAKAKQEQSQKGGRLGSILVKMGVITEEILVSYLSKEYDVMSVELGDFTIDPSILRLIPSEVAQRYQIVPFNQSPADLIIVMADPSNIFVMDDIKFMTGKNIEVLVAAESSIKKAIEKYYEDDAIWDDVINSIDTDLNLELVEEEKIDENELAKAIEDAPVIRLANLILTDAIKKGASDIHVEPYEKSFRVRYRLDGTLFEVMQPPAKLKNALISRFKIMAEMDIAERRVPQDGRIKIKLPNGKDMDFRVNSLPTLFGEKIVLRLLDKSNLQLDMTKLGYEENSLKWFQEAIRKPFGMVLVTGPTGSGKTVSLYSALAELNKTSENISTAEDPVEFNFAGINQVQINEDIGLSFSKALRAFLRQDPDIIMIGEVRDLETAEIAIKAALTGHMVLSTLHTNDAPSTINRLLNMGIEPFLVSSAIQLITAQRLARRVCPKCCVVETVPVQALIDAGARPEEAGDYVCYKGEGCDACNHTGYKGRIGIYQVMPMFEEIRQLILSGANSKQIDKEAQRLGVKTMRQGALSRLKEGVISFEEVLRCTIEDD